MLATLALLPCVFSGPGEPETQGRGFAFVAEKDNNLKDGISQFFELSWVFVLGLFSLFPNITHICYWVNIDPVAVSISGGRCQKIISQVIRPAFPEESECGGGPVGMEGMSMPQTIQSILLLLLGSFWPLLNIQIFPE